MKCTLLVSFTPINSIDFFYLVYILDLFYFTSVCSGLECTSYLTLTPLFSVFHRFQRLILSYFCLSTLFYPVIRGCLISFLSNKCT